MKPLKILNLYACLGGNRYKWDDLGEVRVTAVEKDLFLAEMYSKRFPEDLVLVGDAHEYLLNNFQKFDFIWSSPPCPTHSKARFARGKTTFPQYPDMKLYEEIILLQKWFKGLWIVENVTPYYKPLIPAKRRGRHLYWSNFNIPHKLSSRTPPPIQGVDGMNELCKFHEIDLSDYHGYQRKDKIARNLVDYEAGKTILSAAMKIKNKPTSTQLKIF